MKELFACNSNLGFFHNLYETQRIPCANEKSKIKRTNREKVLMQIVNCYIVNVILSVTNCKCEPVFLNSCSFSPC